MKTNSTAYHNSSNSKTQEEAMQFASGILAEHARGDHNSRIFSASIKTVLLRASASLMVCLVGACADVDAPGGPASHLQSKERVWIAFLQAHSMGDYFVDFQGMPKITLTQTDREKLETLPLTEIPSANEADAIVMSSGDSDLIKLHLKMKTAENAMRSSPEYARLSKATDRLELIQRAYSNHSGAQYLDTIHSGASIPEIDAVGAALNRADAQSELARQSNSTVHKAEVEGEKANTAFMNVHRHYAMPVSDLLSVMQRYVPSGGKTWSSRNALGPFATYFSYMYADMPPNIREQVHIPHLQPEYGTWTY